MDIINEKDKIKEKKQKECQERSPLAWKMLKLTKQMHKMHVESTQLCKDMLEFMRHLERLETLEQQKPTIVTNATHPAIAEAIKKKPKPKKKKSTPSPKSHPNTFKRLYSFSVYKPILGYMPSKIFSAAVGYTSTEARAYARKAYPDVGGFNIKVKYQPDYTEDMIEHFETGEILDKLWLLRHDLTTQAEDQDCPRCKEELMTVKYNANRYDKGYYCEECEKYGYCKKCESYRLNIEDNICDSCEELADEII